MSEDLLSRGTRALWGLVEPGRRGPKPKLSIADLASAGVALADAEGLDAVTMSAVAKQVGMTTMALYRYVDSREDLLAAMADAALGEPPALPRRNGGPSHVPQWAEAEAARLGTHPWVLDVRTGSPPIGPHHLAWMDAGMRAFDRTGLDGQATSSVLLVVDGFVRSTVSFAVQYGGTAGDRWADQLRLVVDPDRLPAVAAALDSGAFEDDGADFPTPDDFAFGLGVVLDGIESLVSRARRPRR